MNQLTIRCYGPLNDFLRAKQRQTAIIVSFAGQRSVKDAIESLGVPHWGIVIEFAGWVCPLTPIENTLRERAGLTAYQGDFIERYILDLLYPVGLTRGMQWFLGGIALAVNALLYWRLASRER